MPHRTLPALVRAGVTIAQIQIAGRGAVARLIYGNGSD